VLIRYLKGHASDYALDPATWAHYRRSKLDAVNLFRVLRPFHEDGAKLQVLALALLLDFGGGRTWLFKNIHRRARRAGGANDHMHARARRANIVITSPPPLPHAIPHAHTSPLSTHTQPTNQTR
jgi:hypothetical protein